MLGTAQDGRGGIASVIRQYAEHGFLRDLDIHIEATHHGRGATGRFVPFLQCAYRLWWAMLRGRISLIHAHCSYRGSFWRKLILLFPTIQMGCPTVLHLHAGKFKQFYAEGGAWRRYWMRYLFRRAFRVVALSEEWRDWVRSVEPAARCVVVSNSLGWETGRRNMRDLCSQPTALFLGRIGENKGCFDLLRAFVRVRSLVPEARLVIGGDGEIDRLRSDLDALHLTDSVSYVGWVDDDEKDRLLSECWLFVLPSYHEGLPMSILEAMAHGKAVVSCPVGGIPEAVAHGTTGLLIAPGNIPELANALVELLSDRSASIRMGNAGRNVFETRFSHEANLHGLVDIYRQAKATTASTWPTTRVKIGSHS
jgi:glycosyltransferase involved in cell wall biosynthesis